jgi:hypothetical protein
VADPIELDIAHRLGRAEARRRLENGIGQLAGFLPNGRVTHHAWAGDTLLFEVEALGQRVGAKLDVLEDKVHVLLDLPPLLAMVARKLKASLLESGTKLLK